MLTWEKKQKIIRHLEKKKKRLLRLVKLFDQFNEESEKPFIAYYQDRESSTLRTDAQIEKLQGHAFYLSVGKLSVYVLHFLQKINILFTVVWEVISLVIKISEFIFQTELYDVRENKNESSLNTTHATYLSRVRALFHKYSIGAIRKKLQKITKKNLFKIFMSLDILIDFFIRLIVQPFMIWKSYQEANDIIASYMDALYHIQNWYLTAKAVYESVQKDKKLAMLCEDLLSNTENLIYGDHNDPYLKEFIELLEKREDFKSFSIFFSPLGDVLKMAVLFEKCYNNPVLLSAIAEFGHFEVLLNLAHYMACTKNDPNGLCYTKFVDDKTNPTLFMDIKGVWNMQIDREVAVANDIYMDGKVANVHLLLGANEGGKTTFLKSFTILSQTYGIFPAKGSNTLYFSWNIYLFRTKIQHIQRPLRLYCTARPPRIRD